MTGRRSHGFESGFAGGAAQSGLRAAAGSSTPGGGRLTKALSFAPEFSVSPPVARKNRPAAAPASILVAGLLSPVNRARVSATHGPPFVRTQPLPNCARRTFVADTRSRLKSSMNE